MEAFVKNKIKTKTPLKRHSHRLLIGIDNSLKTIPNLFRLACYRFNFTIAKNIMFLNQINMKKPDFNGSAEQNELTYFSYIKRF